MNNDNDGQSLVFRALLQRAVDPDALPWRPFQPGVDIFTLYGVVGETRAAALLRYQPGAVIPAHAHTGREHILVLRGSQRDEQGVYASGTLVVHPPGTSHGVDSPEGCIVLVLWDSPVRFLAPSSPISGP